MIYKHLLEELQELSPAQLEQDVTIHLSEVDEYVPAWAVGIAVETGSMVDTSGVLDDDHIVLVS